jgi:hypothetical protein
MTTASDAPGPARPLRTILIAGGTAGFLDINAAFAYYGLRGVSPLRILQSVACGLLGLEAFTGGAGTAALGTVLHFFIATVAAAVYFLASRRLGFLVRRPWEAGAAYGVAVYLFMNHLVVPLSAFPKRPFDLRTALVQVIIHIVCIGWPIAAIVRRGVLRGGRPA